MTNEEHFFLDRSVLFSRFSFGKTYYWFCPKVGSLGWDNYSFSFHDSRIPKIPILQIHISVCMYVCMYVYRFKALMKPKIFNSLMRPAVFCLLQIVQSIMSPIIVSRLVEPLYLKVIFNRYVEPCCVATYLGLLCMVIIMHGWFTKFDSRIIFFNAMQLVLARSRNYFFK